MGKRQARYAVRIYTYIYIGFHANIFPRGHSDIIFHLLLLIHQLLYLSNTNAYIHVYGWIFLFRLPFHLEQSITSL